jgi:hypothetical protein
MSKRVLITGFALLLLTLCIAPASAQVQPFIGAFFNEGLTEETKDCPGAVLDTLYVAMYNANAFVIGAQYQITYPASMNWLADVGTPPATIGITPTGISMGYPLPLNGFFPILLHSVLIQWFCQDCTGSVNDQLVVGTHPQFPGSPFWTNWPAFDQFPAIGLTSTICQEPPIATEETTWGKLKALYNE